MGEIKSALELALERTRDIAEDRSGLKAREFREQGMKLLVRFEQESDFDLAAALKKFGKDERDHVLAGIRTNLEGILSLPANPEAVERFKRLAPALIVLSGQSPMVQEYVRQLEGFFARYLENKQQLLDAAAQQFEPALRKKEEALARQTGRRVHLQPEQDPDFNRFVNQNLEALQGQFNQTLDQVKGQVYAALGWD